MAIHLDLLSPISSSDQPELCLERPSYAHEFLLGLAPGGACHAFFVAKKAVSSYLPFSPLPEKSGGIFSVALSLKLPWPAVSWHHSPWSPDFPQPYGCSHPTIRNLQNN